jgi:hypothetical protein
MSQPPAGRMTRSSGSFLPHEPIRVLLRAGKNDKEIRAITGFGLPIKARGIRGLDNAVLDALAFTLPKVLPAPE